MTTINEENRKTLRKSMKVVCDFQETDEAPTSLTPIGIAAEYVGVAGVNSLLDNISVMDLAGDGFLNDGVAEPMYTQSDTYRYGYISEDVAQADGSFLTPFGVEISSANNWDTVTLEIANERGEKETQQITPTWLGGTTTIYIDRWEPGSRAYLLSVHLGKYWRWDNSTLLGVNLDLRGVNTQIGGELEVSSIEIQAYEPNDYTDVIGRIPIGAPIRYMAGYYGDMSEIRKFYLSEAVSWNNNVLTVHGQDATMLVEDDIVEWRSYNISANSGVPYFVTLRLRAALANIDYKEVGSYPTDKRSPAAQEVYFESVSPREMLSLYTNIMRDVTYLRATYVDAGIPTLTLGDNFSNFVIYDDEISDLNIIVEQNINTIKANLATFDVEAEFKEYTRINCVANRTYYVNFDVPIAWIQWSAGVISREWIDYNTWKFVAQYTQEYIISIREIIPVISNGDNPYRTTGTTPGADYYYSETIPSLLINEGSLTKKGLDSLLNRSNIVYEFNYRGNPHIQPRDTLDVQIATWITEQIVIDGLYPETDLYPAADLYPNARYKEDRKMKTEWVSMTVDSLTIDHSEGGTISKIRARKGVV